MSASVGNPYFNNKTKTVEPHLLHEFSDDFYGSEIRLVITGYLRPEANFDNLGTHFWSSVIFNVDFFDVVVALCDVCDLATKK